MLKIRRVLISVSDKTGLEDLVKCLHEFGVEILSTGGTAKLISGLGIPVRSVSDYTGFPEMLDGRVKTLHPKIHGGLLSLRGKESHMKQVKDHDIELIDMVVVNLYPFEKTVAKESVELEEAIEKIDIGGPSMLRSAAKNYRSVAVVTKAERYQPLIEEMRANKGYIGEAILASLAVDVFELTAHYDNAIYGFLAGRLRGASETTEDISLKLKKKQQLRYGENPHQKAAFYVDEKVDEPSASLAKQLHGKGLSFNNIIDLNAALEIVKEFEGPAASVMKHTNPCGAATADTLAKAYLDALECDRLSAFGSIVGFNKEVDEDTAKAILENADFVECIIAPGYNPAALKALRTKKNLRIMEVPCYGKEVGSFEPDMKKVVGGLLVQERDVRMVQKSDLKVVTKKKPSESELKSLLFGWRICKHVKSNAIVLCQGTRTVGIGAGQMSRVDSVIISARKAGKKAKGSALASDAFFPKADGIEEAAACGATSIIQPGGSMRDAEVIAAADKLGLSMVFTGMRHFKH